MLSTHMARCRPIGICKQTYQEKQAVINQENAQHDLLERVNNLSFAHDAMNERVNDVIANQGSETKKLSIEMQNGMDKLVGEIKRMKNAITFLQEAMQKPDVRLIDLSDECEAFSKTVQEQLKTLKSLLDDAKKSQDVLKQEILNLYYNLQTRFDMRLQDAKLDILSKPSDVPALRDELDKRFEFVELNGQNALVRSANNEKQLQLIERKIENIYQLIKSLDLKMQEKQ